MRGVILDARNRRGNNTIRSTKKDEEVTSRNERKRVVVTRVIFSRVPRNRTIRSAGNGNDRTGGFFYSFRFLDPWIGKARELIATRYIYAHFLSRKWNNRSISEG